MIVVVLSMVLLILAAWIALGALPAGADAHMPLPYMIALIPLMWVPSLAIAVAAIVMREWGLLCLAVAVALSSQMREVGYWSHWSPSRDLLGLFARSGASNGNARNGAAAKKKPAHGQRSTEELLADIREARRETEINASETASDVLAQRTSSSASFTVMTLNCRYGRANAKDIVATVLSRNITVLALQELTADLVRELDDNGLDMLMSYHQLGEDKETDNGGFNGIWIRVDPKSAERSAVPIPAADVPSVTLQVDPMRDITFASAHPKSPMRGCRDWSAGIRGLGRLADTAKRTDHDIAVILGDLNSSPDHPSFRALLRSGFTDANLSLGEGRRATFPSWIPWPRIVLDHALATKGARFTGVESFPIEGTDHLALVATVALD